MSSTKLIVGQVSSQEKSYTGCRECKKKDCSCGKHDMGEIKFMTYSTKVGDRWYSVKGWGAKNIKEGDTIEGEVTSKEWSGKTYYTITLPKPDPNAKIAELEQKLETLESKVFALEQATFKQTSIEDEPPLTDDDAPEDLELEW